MLQFNVCTHMLTNRKPVDTSFLPSFVSLQKAVQKLNKALNKKQLNQAVSRLRLYVTRIWFLKWQHNFHSPQRRRQLWADRTKKNSFRFSTITAVQVSTTTFVHLLQRLRMHGFIIFMVAPCIDDIKFFICRTNAHKMYSIVKLLKQ
jgi:hypothetical protein